MPAFSHLLCASVTPEVNGLKKNVETMNRTDFCLNGLLFADV